MFLTTGPGATRADAACVTDGVGEVLGHWSWRGVSRSDGVL